MPEVASYQFRSHFFMNSDGGQKVRELRNKYQFHSGISDLFESLVAFGDCSTLAKDRFFYVGYILSKENIPFEVSGIRSGVSGS